MNRITSLVVAAIVGASSIVGAGSAARTETPAMDVQEAQSSTTETIVEYVYVESEPDIEYIYIDASEEQLQAAFDDGYRQGKSDWYGDGYAAGYHDCMDDFGLR